MRKSAPPWIAFIKDKGLPVKLITMTVGKCSSAGRHQYECIGTAAHEQRVQTEQQTKLAEVQRKAAEEARAAADNAYRHALGPSPEQHAELKRIEMESAYARKASAPSSRTRARSRPSQ